MTNDQLKALMAAIILSQMEAKGLTADPGARCDRAVSLAAMICNRLGIL